MWVTGDKWFDFRYKVSIFHSSARLGLSNEENIRHSNELEDKSSFSLSIVFLFFSIYFSIFQFLSLLYIFHYLCTYLSCINFSVLSSVHLSFSNNLNLFYKFVFSLYISLLSFSFYSPLLSFSLFFISINLEFIFWTFLSAYIYENFPSFYSSKPFSNR